MTQREITKNYFFFECLIFAFFFGILTGTLVISGTVPDKGCIVVAGKYVQSPDSDLKCVQVGQNVKVSAP